MDSLECEHVFTWELVLTWDTTVPSCRSCRYAEVLILVIFILLALLWLTREPKFIPGWGHIFQTEESGKRYMQKDIDVNVVAACIFCSLANDKNTCTCIMCMVMTNG
jgi:hypothetical protein